MRDFSAKVAKVGLDIELMFLPRDGAVFDIQVVDILEEWHGSAVLCIAFLRLRPSGSYPCKVLGHAGAYPKS